MANAGKNSKKVKSLPARDLTPGQEKSVKGGSTVALPAIQKPAEIAACDGSVRTNANASLNFNKV